MALNLNFNWFTDGSTFEVETVFLHENGHVAGLGHSAVIGAVMEPNYAGERRALHADDIAGITFLYPGGAPPVPPTLESIAVTPANASVEVGQDQQFTATGTYDDESTADISGSVAWSSSDANVATVDASGLATGVVVGNTGVSASLDAVGSNIASLEVTAAPPPPPPGSTVNVDSITYATEGGRNGDKHLLVFVHVVDNLGGDVVGASVSVELFRDGSSAGTATGITGANGVAGFTLKNARSGTYTTNVDNVSYPGSTWDGLTPANEFTK